MTIESTPSSPLGAGSSILPSLPPDGWLRTVRASQGLTQQQAAERVGVTQQAYHQFETGEVRATITLDRLQRAAEALGFELVYFLRPQTAPATRPKARAAKAVERRAVVDEELPLSLL